MDLRQERQKLSSSGKAPTVLPPYPVSATPPTQNKTTSSVRSSSVGSIERKNKPEKEDNINNGRKKEEDEGSKEVRKIRKKSRYFSSKEGSECYRLESEQEGKAASSIWPDHLQESSKTPGGALQASFTEQGARRYEQPIQREIQSLIILKRSRDLLKFQKLYNFVILSFTIRMKSLDIFE